MGSMAPHKKLIEPHSFNATSQGTGCPKHMLSVIVWTEVKWTNARILGIFSAR
jgi:hypothetical protein